MIDIGNIFISVAEFLALILIFAISVSLIKWVYRKLKSNAYLKSNRLFNPKEYLPSEEIYSLKQLYYLIMILVIVTTIIYGFINWNSNVFSLLAGDVIVSLYLACQMDINSRKSKIIFILLVPYGVLILFGNVIALLDILHSFVFIYFIKFYFDKFMHYTKTNSLGITIVLMFGIIFVSFFITMMAERVSPLNSLEMVSNAFTSNGYAILGENGLGKINAIFLVWSGFILSGVGTATLTVSIVKRHINKRFDNIEEMINKKK